MSNFSKAKYMVSGFLIGAVFFGSVAMAATSKIDVSFDAVKFIIDKVDKTPADNKFNNNGTNVPASLIYQGTTYIPLRLASNMLNKPIEWDGKTRSVLVGDSVAGGDYLSNMPPVDVAAGIYINPQITLGSQKYNSGLFFTNQKVVTQSYNINAQYKQLSFLYGTDDTSSSGTYSNITVLGDGKELWTSTAVQGVPAQPASINIDGVLKISIVVVGTTKRYVDEVYTVIVNPILSK